MSLQAVPRPVSPQPPAKLYTPQVQIAVARSWGDAFSCLKTWLGIPERRKRIPSDIGWVEWVAFTVFVAEQACRRFWARHEGDAKVLGGLLGCLAAFALTAYVVITVMSQWPE